MSPSDGGSRSGQRNVELLPTPPSGGGQVTAIGPTDLEGIFVAFVPGIGFRYVDLTTSPGKWTTAAGSAVTVASQFGLLYQHRSGENATACFVESPARRWCCMQMPKHGGNITSKDQAVLVEHMEFTSEVSSVCRFPGSAVAVLALASGSVRFMDLETGKAACKALKLEAGAGGAATGGVVLAALGPRRVAAVRPNAELVEFFIVEMEVGETPKAVIRTQGRIEGVPKSLPSLRALPVAGRDRLLLGWGSTGAPSFAFVDLAMEAPVAEQLPTSERKTTSPLWLCIKGHLAQLIAGPKGSKDLEFSVRDARFGMPVASATLSLASSGKTQLLHATAGDVTVLVGSSASDLAAVRWSLPAFSLQALIGSSVDQAVAAQASLVPLREAACSKRKRDDPAVEELFSAKRRAGTDKELAAELQAHSWGTPTHELVDVVVKKQCLASARALLKLPELGEDLSVRLLGADPRVESELLALLVRRSSTPRLLEAALADHLPAALLPVVLESLIEWLNAYRDYPEGVVQEFCPELPSQWEIFRFLSAVADGCLPSLLRLDADLLERVKEVLFHVQKLQHRWERLHAVVRATARLSMSGIRKAPAVEAVLLDF